MSLISSNLIFQCAVFPYNYLPTIDFHENIIMHYIKAQTYYGINRRIDSRTLSRHFGSEIFTRGDLCEMRFLFHHCHFFFFSARNFIFSPIRSGPKEWPLFNKLLCIPKRAGVATFENKNKNCPSPGQGPPPPQAPRRPPSFPFLNGNPFSE